MINKIKEDIWQLNFKEFGSCVYILKIKNKLIMIDTGSVDCKSELLEDLKILRIKPEEINIILLTHSHWDHIGNISLFKNAKAYSYKELKKNKFFERIMVIKTPGHTTDSLCFIYKNILFSGDTLFNKGFIGRTDFPESSEKEMENSLKKLKKIKYDILCPGH